MRSRRLQEDTEVDFKGFGQKIGIGRISFGKPDLLMELLGVEPGGVTPFGLINDTETRVTVVLEERLMAHEVVNFHPLTNAATTSIRPDDLLKFIRACGHEPAIIAVG